MKMEVQREDKEIEMLNPRPVWALILALAIIQVSGMYGLYLAAYHARWQTLLYTAILYVLSIWGTTAGAHRYFTHRSFEAKRPLQLLFIALQTLAAQLDVITWVKIHRLHHKYTGTDADPHNSKRGFFFSHIGWLLVPPHAEVLQKVKLIDFSDVSSDPVLRFQRKYYTLLLVLSCTLVAVPPVFLWSETWTSAIFVSNMLRIFILSHAMFSINSVAHCCGTKPFDKNLKAGNHLLVTFFTTGEGMQNYHHAFPVDYKCDEFDGAFNLSTVFLDLCGELGWAYDFKFASADVIEQRITNFGDGSHPYVGKNVLSDVMQVKECL